MSNFSVALAAELLPTIVLIIGVLAFIVSVVTEVIKSIGRLSEIPTDIVVIVLSLVFTVVALFAYMEYASVAFMWYYLVGAVIGAFFVAFIAMYGWTKLTELWDRFKPEGK